MRFLLSLLFSLMVYPPNSNTLPTIGWGVYRNYIYFARYFLLLYRACLINKLLEYLTFNKYLIPYHKYVVCIWIVRHQPSEIFLTYVEVLFTASLMVRLYFSLIAKLSFSISIRYKKNPFFCIVILSFISQLSNAQTYAKP